MTDFVKQLEPGEFVTIKTSVGEIRVTACVERVDVMASNIGTAIRVDIFDDFVVSVTQVSKDWVN